MKSSPLELIHSDVWSCSTQSLSGCRYYVLFIDDFSWFTWLYPIQNKSDVYACFLKFKVLIENQLSCKYPCSSGLKLLAHDGEPLSAAHITEYHQTIGALPYCTLTRPDIAFSVNQLCQHMHCPRSTHWSPAKRVLYYLKGTIDNDLWYQKGSFILQSYCDSDWAGNPNDCGSTTGYGVFLGSCLVSWTAKKQTVVARSSIEAEYRALAITIVEIYWVRMFLKELCISLPIPPTIWCDNIGALALASNPVFHARTKHIEVDYHFLREKVLNKDITLQFICSQYHIADVFTKGLSTSRFCELRNKLQVCLPPSSL
ncbi:hypothetical protein Patl1_18655 [Pistacia atlantica]|uniref:Uncharacterized protein n=1 Tax=Pistacia atlantica TaxID=434234 RepID=A0ACC1C1H7_9ROSI|nr:hypothetical protein Patl1_18655 [Pistacia atlantica]